MTYTNIYPEKEYKTSKLTLFITLLSSLCILSGICLFFVNPNEYQPKTTCLIVDYPLIATVEGQGDYYTITDVYVRCNFSRINMTNIVYTDSKVFTAPNNDSALIFKNKMKDKYANGTIHQCFYSNDFFHIFDHDNSDQRLLAICIMIIGFVCMIFICLSIFKRD